MSQGVIHTRAHAMAAALLATLGVKQPSQEELDGAVTEMRRDYVERLASGEYIRTQRRLQCQFVRIPRLMHAEGYVLNERRAHFDADVLVFHRDGKPERCRIRKDWLQLKGAA